MAGDKSIKITFQADTSGLSKGIKSADNEVQTFGQRIGEWGKKAAAAFAVVAAAAAAYAVKLGVDGVKAAMADEQAQQKLALTLRNVAGATDEQIKSTEEWISKTQLAYGVSDEQLRPALERLVRATKDVGEAQKLTSLAMDVAAGSGKSLESVSQALGKAYEGNTTSLGKLGLGIDKAELKTMSFEEITAKLAETFGGQAAAKADTFAGKVARLSEAWSEAKETVGSFIIDALNPLLTLATEKIIPALGDFGNAIGEKVGSQFKDLAAFIRDSVIPFLGNLWTFIKETIIPGFEKFFTPILHGLAAAFKSITEKIVENKDKFEPLLNLFKEIAEFVSKYLAPIIGTVLGKALEVIGSTVGKIITAIGTVVDTVTKALEKAINTAIWAINKLITAYNAIPFLNNVNYLSNVSFSGGGGSGGGGSSNDLDAARYAAMIPTITNTMNTALSGLTGALGSASSGGSKTGGASDAEVNQTIDAIQNMVNQLQVMYAETEIAKLNYLYDLAKQSGTVINVNGYTLDPEGTARALEDVLYQNQIRTGTPGAVDPAYL